MFANRNELKAGDFVLTWDGFRCIDPGKIVRLNEDKDGVYFICRNGRHYIDDLVQDGVVHGLSKALEPIEITDPIVAPPVLSGPKSKAWLTNNAEGRRIMGIKAEQDACLSHWVIEAPWAHPAWHSYSLIVVHLRPIKSIPPAELYVDGATHEMWLFAIDPHKDRNELIETGITNGHWLSPINFGAQFIEITDDLAVERIRNTVQMICDGKLSPDTDYRADWARLFGHNMLKIKSELKTKRPC